MSEKKSRVTRQDVANKAGVSTATVSYVLNGLGEVNNISLETQRRVKEAIAELNYVRNVSAHRLASGKTRVIALIVDSKTVNYAINATIHRIQQGVSDVCLERSYHSIVHGVVNNDWASIKETLALSNRVDGIIVINPPTQQHIFEELLKDHFPVVTLGSVRIPHEYSVNIDNYHAAKIATQHLIAQGHERIVHITYALPDLTDVLERSEGYKQAMIEADLEAHIVIRYAAYSFESAADAMTDLLLGPDRPSAVFAGNDVTAIGCMSAIGRQGLRVPDDLAIIGFDDIPVSAYLTPPLTTIKLDGEKQGRLAAGILLDLVEGRTPVQKTVALESPLISRGSV